MGSTSFKLAVIAVLWTAPSLLLGQDVSVMTYNIRYDNPDDGRNAWPKRKAELANQISFYGPDILGIQEGLLHQVKYLDSALLDYRYVGQGREDGRRKGEFCAIYYRHTRFDKLQEGTLWLSETPDRPSTGWDAALPRIATWVRLDDLEDGRTLVVINTHFDHQGTQAREESAKLLINFVKSLERQGDDAIVLMGDLNATPEEAPIRQLDFSLFDSHDESVLAPFGPTGTWANWQVGNPLDRRIDYIWVNEGLAVEKYAVLTDHRDGRYYSDHLPVWVLLSRY
ncbi:MAG: endonuclease/exonuclease/phosphatase family protein [Bacteroidota bacterium]